MAAKIGSVMQSQGALVMLVVVCSIATIRYEAFLTPENLLNVLRQNSMSGLIALGMTFVILTGGIDLSVGSLLALAGVVAAYLLPNGVFVAVLGAVTVTTLLGLVNGIIIAKAKIQPFIVTLGMMIATRGLALAITDEKSVRIGQTFEDFIYLGRGVIGDFLPVPVLILLIAFAAGWVVLNYTRFGRHVYALGDNDEAARLLGLNISRTTIGVYAISGALAGLAGVILAARLGAGNPVEGVGIELGAIAAVVVGGTLLTGGQGNVLSTLVGVLLLGVIFNIFNLEGQISPWWQPVLRGVILLVVVVIQNRLTKLK
ncbi:ABC transporter permease [Hymenobacter sp. BT664]|uniref:ABC transporter permease n=2 Tax=Hymenobacter montanus TaxID=2771359 RepID=A0A927BA03_9BACT|nr:ABC transporter permease [Hymenobacter montanus]